jgi:hypothetical protein
LSVSPIGRHGACRAVERDIGRGRGTRCTAEWLETSQKGNGKALSQIIADTASLATRLTITSSTSKVFSTERQRAMFTNMHFVSLNAKRAHNGILECSYSY